MAPSFQTRLKGLLDRYTPESLYTAYELGSEEYVGTVEKPPEQFQLDLHIAGYGLLPKIWGIILAAAKRHPESGDLHSLTRRKIPSDGDTIQHVEAETVDTGLEQYDPEQLQYHVHVFRGGDVFSHLELRSDPYPVAGETWSEAIGRLMIHYRPKYDATYLEGASEPKLEQLL